MTKRMKPVTALELRALAKREGKHSIGSGLLLKITRPGHGSWTARLTVPSGKRRDIGLGPYPEVELGEARERVSDYKRMIRDGIDPLSAKRVADRIMPTFIGAARQAHGEREAGFKNRKHAAQWLETLERYAAPYFGDVPICDIDGPMVVNALKPIWNKKPETARRTLQRIATVVAWSAAHGHRSDELPVKSIRMGLPPQRAVVRNHPAVPHRLAYQVIKSLSKKSDSTSRQALLFTILTASRSGEARKAKWADIDIEARKWTVPASDTKMGRDHAVALSPEAIALLEIRRDAIDVGGLVFASATGKPLSDVALSNAQKDVASGTTVHGWRSTFRDWAAEETGVPREIAEAALAHANPNRVEASYLRTDYFDLRLPLMTAWAGFIYGVPNWRELLSPDRPGATVHRIAVGNR